MKKKLIVILMLTASLGMLGGGVWYWWYSTPPAMPNSLDQAFETLQSGRFKRLSDAEQRRYYDRMAELSSKMSEQEKKDFRDKMKARAKADPNFEKSTRDVMAGMILAQARQYAAKTPAERKDLVAKTVMAMNLAEMTAAFKPKTPPVEKTATQIAEETRRRDEMNRFMHGMLRTGNPQEQQYWEEFVKEIMKMRVAQGREPFPVKR